jgi:hypothetical protein
VHRSQLPDQRKKRGPRKRRDETVIIVLDQRDQHTDAGMPCRVTMPNTAK